MLRDEQAIYFIDNQSALSAMVKGSSRDVAMSGIAHLTALRQQEMRTRAWYEWVPSAENLADLPSRGDLAGAARLLVEYFNDRYPVYVRELVEIPPLPVFA